jgi:hypothetical protein
MKKNIFGFLVAVLIGSVLGQSTQSQPAKAATAIVVWCTNASSSTNSSGAVTSVTELCGNAPSDTSGVTLNFQITQPTQRYPLNTTATIPLP